MLKQIESTVKGKGLDFRVEIGVSHHLLHVLDLTSGERAALLSRLANLLASSTPRIGVHFEMASFVEESIMEDLLHFVIPRVCMSFIILYFLVLNCKNKTKKP